MEKILYNFCRQNGGRITFDNPLDLVNWDNYHLNSIYIDADGLRLVSLLTSPLPWTDGEHIQDIYWCGVCDEYQEAVYNAVSKLIGYDNNLF